MQDTIMGTIDKALVKIKKDQDKAIRNAMKILKQEMELKMWCQTEKLEIITVESIFVSLDWRKMWGQRMVAK